MKVDPIRRWRFRFEGERQCGPLDGEHGGAYGWSQTRRAVSWLDDLTWIDWYFTIFFYVVTVYLASTHIRFTCEIVWLARNNQSDSYSHILRIKILCPTVYFSRCRSYFIFYQRGLKLWISTPRLKIKSFCSFVSFNFRGK